jgi:hypothetical protein
MEARNTPCSNQSGQTIGTKLRSNQLQLVIEPLSLVLNLIYIFISKADVLIGKIHINAKHDASTNSVLQCKLFDFHNAADRLIATIRR